MSGICGWLMNTDEAAHSQALLLEMARGLSEYDNSGMAHRTVSRSALAVASLASKDIYSDAESLCAIEGNFRWEDKTLKAVADEAGAAAAVIEGFRSRGPAFLDYLKGTFSLVVVDEKADSVFMAADRIGVHTLFFEQTGEGLLFGSNPNLLRRHPQSSTTVATQAVYDYLYFHVVPAPESIYRNQTRLLPGYYLYKQGATLDIQPYWQLDFDRNYRDRPFSELKAQFTALLRCSIEQSLDNKSVGAFLSGGTDSSTVCGLLTEIEGRPAQTYSIGFDEAGYDEMEYARLAAKHFGTSHHEYYVSAQDIVDAIPRIAEIYSQPFGNSSAVPAYYCAKMAQADGVDLMLAGDGGDELFAGNARYAKQQTFALYERLPAWSRTKLLEPLLLNSEIAERIWPLRKAKSYIAQASIPMPARMETYNLLERSGIHSVLTDEFLEQVSTENPLVLLGEYYGNVKAGTLLNKMLGLDIKFTLADNDLQKVTRMCELAGIGVAYPLLSDELAEFSAKLPPQLKLKGSRLRYFFKESLKGFLPDEIISKKKHGFGLPFGHWCTTHPALRALVNDSLSDLKARGIVRADFIDELTDKLLPAYPHYYGEMVWILTMLEQWMKCHVDGR